MIDGKLSVSQNTLCMPHSAISYMDVWVFCSKVTQVATLLMDRVELTNHNSIRQKSLKLAWEGQRISVETTYCW